MMKRRMKMKKRIMKKRMKELEGIISGMSPDPKKIVVEIHPNLEKRTYHMVTEISQHPIRVFDRPLRKSSEKYMEEVGDVGSRILRETLAVSGVVSVAIYPYELGVEKGKAFSWDTLEPAILNILKDVSEKKTKRADTIFSTKERPRPVGMLA